MSPEELRACFDQVSEAHLREPLLGRYQIRRVSRADWLAAFDSMKDSVFPGDTNLDITRAWTDAHRERFGELNALLGSPLDHNLILVDSAEGDIPVGWAYGVQAERATWYMAITAIHPDYRGRGIYGAFLQRLLPLLAEVGFREVHSRHHADNNAVLIAKLKAGFTIAAFEIAPNYGLLVHLRYTFSEGVRQIYAWRVDGRVGAEALRERGILKGA